ncbi:hypothetical protein N7532_003728 [Penicillium argentinense]|uniref:DDE-1 domain-containing protein n=1 Tax=Penicillium argentinense TaxID=1131581 RepID=A0A9W9KE94_9EURO|nr:uncharacterized protein N7532_003728 [Penicillium argentinense]KAJ5103199.1 hypothetical protein N7532_003728 [Penicillium argentinense]
MGPRNAEGRDEPSNSKRSQRKIHPSVENTIVTHAQRWIELGHPVKNTLMVVEVANSHLNSIQWRLPPHERDQVASGWEFGLFNLHPSFKDSYQAARLNERKKVPDPNPDDELMRLLDFLDKFNEIKRKYDIIDENVFAVSELGYVTTVRSEKQPGMVLYRPESKKKETRQYSSVIHCVQSGGRHLPPYVTVKSNEPPRPERHGSIQMAFNKDGWADETHALDWLKTVFDPISKERINSARMHRLLLVDSRRFQVTTDFENYCERRQIVCLCIPKRTQEMFSPFYCGIFDSLANIFIEHMKQKLHQSRKDTFTIDPKAFVDFINTQLASRQRLSESKDAWLKTCLMPVDRAALKNRFRGRQATLPPQTQEAVVAPDDSVSIIAPGIIPTTSTVMASSPTPTPETPPSTDSQPRTPQSSHVPLLPVSERKTPAPPLDEVASTVPRQRRATTPVRTPDNQGRPNTFEIAAENFRKRLNEFEDSSPRSRKRHRDRLVSDYSRSLARAEFLEEELNDYKKRGTPR